MIKGEDGEDEGNISSNDEEVDQEIFTQEEMINLFSLNAVSKSASKSASCAPPPQPPIVMCHHICSCSHCFL